VTVPTAIQQYHVLKPLGIAFATLQGRGGWVWKRLIWSMQFSCYCSLRMNVAISKNWIMNDVNERLITYIHLLLPMCSNTFTIARKRIRIYQSNAFSSYWFLTEETILLRSLVLGDERNSCSAIPWLWEFSRVCPYSSAPNCTPLSVQTELVSTRMWTGLSASFPQRVWQLGKPEWPVSAA
jgi:hypothetical protein